MLRGLDLERREGERSEDSQKMPAGDGSWAKGMSCREGRFENKICSSMGDSVGDRAGGGVVTASSLLQKWG